MAAEISDRVREIAEARGVPEYEIFERALEHSLEDLWEDIDHPVIRVDRSHIEASLDEPPSMFPRSTANLEEPTLFRLAPVEQIQNERNISVIVPLRLNGIVEGGILGVQSVYTSLATFSIKVLW